MRKSDIYEVAIKILGLYLFYTSIGLLRDLLFAVAYVDEAKRNPDLFEHIDPTPYFILSIAHFIVVILFASAIHTPGL